ncbi:MAG: aminopeptidase P family protein [Herpetosiphon sp.]
MVERLQQLRDGMVRAELAGLAVVPGANLQYLLGLSIHLSERLAIAVFTPDGEIHMVLPSLEAPRVQAEASVPVVLYPWTDDEGYAPALEECLLALDLDGLLGVEHTRMRVLELRAIEEYCPVGIVDGDPVLATLRAVKSATELTSMRRAVYAVEEGLRQVVAQIRPGITERELAKLWEQGMFKAGATAQAFTTIVASGPNSANPHHTTGDRRLEAGDLVVLDGGAIVDGYCSDITRTIALAPLEAELQRVYEAVLAANEQAVAAVRPGVTGATVDGAARGVIDAAGFGPLFLHRTGHGLGIEAHEPPFMNQGEDTPLQCGMTFTIEPGVYLAGRGGVRIEDDVLVTDAGVEVLTGFERTLMVIG